MNFTAFLAYVFITAFTPGPNNIMAMTNSMKYGLRRAMVFCFGVLVGFFILMPLCALATSALYEHIPAIEPWMRLIGAAYIVYLAVVVYLDRGESKERKTAMAPDGFFTGLVMNLINIKVILYGLTALSTFVLPYYRTAGALALAVLFLSVVGFSGTACWAVFGSLFQKFHARHRKVLNAIMALLLLYCAAMI